MNPERTPSFSEQAPDKETLTSLEKVQILGKETGEELEQKSGAVISHIEESSLSSDKKRWHLERTKALRESYAEYAAKLRNAAILATALAASSPAFGLEVPSEEIAPVQITQSVDSSAFQNASLETNIENETETQLEAETLTPQEKPSVPPSLTNTTPEELGGAVAELLEPAVAAEIIKEVVITVAKDKLNDFKESPVETGIATAGRFMKGPLSNLSQVIDLAKEVKESADKKETGEQVLKKFGTLLLNMKTFGLGGLVLNYLQSQPSKP